ncbi:nitroreductase family protein [Trichlorobacter lovleyi]|uniref:nitroreductase family protein n=1 Tax=Trichlorobacter lovleyi TaxID=313985 RepID=UPI002240876A|nr:nitroreductase family protein [Trichlorobacter lovleyi]QOX79988.1 nitroreductase family protein [Trichlorobacter lovleyi]
MIELIRKRRSIRSFTGQALETKQVELLVEALLRAPTSRSINPWEFVLVDDGELLARLSTAKLHGSGFLKGAALAVVICADETRSDVWVEDCSIAAILLQMTVQSLGLGSCWAQIRQRQHDKQMTAEQFVQELLGLPARIRVEAIIGIGYPAEKRRALAVSQLDYSKIRHNRYDKLWGET